MRGAPVKRLLVCLVENSALFQSALISMLHRMALSVTTTSAVQLGKRRERPLVVLVDVVTSTETSRELEELVDKYSHVAPVLLLAREDRIEQLISGLRGGAVGFVKQTASLSQLRRAIMAVAQGSTWCDTRLFQKIMKYLPIIHQIQHPSLTIREREVLRLVSFGERNKEIAAHLGLTEQSIKVYVSNLLKKTGASNRSRLTMYAVTCGLLGTR